MKVRGLTRMLARLFAIFGALYLSGCVLMFSSQRKLIFPAPHPVVTPAYGGGEVVRVKVIDAEDAIAFHVPAGPGRRTVVYFHGNGDQIGNAAWLSDALGREGLGFFAIEYPGYGLARGAPSEQSIYTAAEASLRVLTGPREVRNDEVVLVGQSIGSGVATEMAKRGFGGRLALVTPYTSLVDVAKGAFPWLPVRLLLRDRFDNAAKAPHIRVPVLIIHGTSDEVVPYALGNELTTRFPRAELVTVDGATHNDVLSGDVALRRLVDFAGED